MYIRFKCLFFLQAFIFALSKNLSDILMGNIKEINIKSPTYFF